MLDNYRLLVKHLQIDGILLIDGGVDSLVRGNEAASDQFSTFIMALSFSDHFSQQADDYARFRPTYPAALYDYLASLTPQHDRAWDVGTGNGQAVFGLARHFRSVIATDPSEQQIALAAPHERVTYRVAPAEHSGLEDQSIDLSTAAMAVHWFDLDRFYAEARRVLKPDGLLAVWCYNLTEITPEVDAVMESYYHNVLGEFWPPQIGRVDEHYRTLPFPFTEIAAQQRRLKERRAEGWLTGAWRRLPTSSA